MDIFNRDAWLCLFVVQIREAELFNKMSMSARASI